MAVRLRPPQPQPHAASAPGDPPGAVPVQRSLTAMRDYLHTLAFGIYPYVAIAIFLAGSLLRFEREQYSWKSGSSQLLRRRQLRIGSNLFHLGILFLMFGHTVGL